MIEWLRGHKAETVKLAEPVMSGPADIIAAAYDTVMPCMSTTGRFDAKGLAMLAQSSIDMKQIAAKPDMAKLATEAFLPPESAAE